MAKKGQGYKDVSKYKPEYCGQLIEHMAAGGSFESFAGVIGVHRDTLYSWIEQHESWSDAKKKGFSAALLYWEEVGKRLALGQIRFGSAAVWIFTITNRFRDLYTNRQVHQVEAPPASAIPANVGPITYEEFAANSGYPKPYPKQIEMMEFGMLGEGARMILGARGYGKTDYVVILGIAYQIYLDRQDTTLIVTKSEERNAAMLTEIAAACEKNGLTFAKKNASCIRVDGLHGKDHSVSTITVGSSSIRGRHPKRIVMDDPVTPEDVSEATRNRVQRVYNEVNKLTGNVLIIGQPVHKWDLYAELRPLIRKMEVPHGSIPELDHDLEAQRMAGITEESIQASYFLTVTSETANPLENVKFIDSYPKKGDSVAFIDPSFEGGDYTAMTVVRAYFEGVAVFGKCWKRAWFNCVDDIAKVVKEFNVGRLCFETNSLGTQPLDILRTKMDIGVVGKKSTTNKHARIMAVGPFAGHIHIAKNADRVYIDQITKYEYESKYDDAPDSLASALEWIGLIRGKKV